MRKAGRGRGLEKKSGGKSRRKCGGGGGGGGDEWLEFGMVWHKQTSPGMDDKAPKAVRLPQKINIP